MKYYIKRGSKKVYAVPNTLMAVQNMAQREADKIGRAVAVFGEEAGRTGRAVAKAYNRNPAKKGCTLIWRDRYGPKSLEYDTPSQAKAALKLAKMQGYEGARIK